MNRKQFLATSPNNNVEWAEQQIVMNFNEDEFKLLRTQFLKLNKALFKGWAKDMTFAELFWAIDNVAHLIEDELKENGEEETTRG